MLHVVISSNKGARTKTSRLYDPKKNDSRDPNGLTQKPENKRHFDPKYCMESTSIKCKPEHCDSCFVVLKVMH